MAIIEHLGRQRPFGLAVFLFHLLAGAVHGAESTTVPTNSPAVSPARPALEESVEAQRMLRSHLQLQEQLHSTLLAIEQARTEATLATRTNSDLLAARLEMIEQALQQQQEQQRLATQNSNKTLVVMVGVFVGVGFLTLLFMALFQLRGMNRLAEIATGLPSHAGALGASSLQLLAAPGDAGPGRLHGVIERLEKRIGELELTTHSPGGQSLTLLANGPRDDAAALADLPAPLAALLGRGESLLKLGQTENALACFDEAATRMPRSAETHLRRGQAFEQLKQLEPALAAYDRAIVLDRSCSLAYLRKGRILNAQERHAEALECYEQAFKSSASATAQAS